MNIKTALVGSISLLALVLSGSASADFSGNFAASNWVLNDNAGGSVDLSNAPLSITLTSGNSGIQGDTLLTTTASVAETVSFNWSYVTNDLWGQSGTDAFGYIVNGVFTQLIDPNQDPSIPAQSGIASFNVNAGDVFGFDANTFDGLYGSSITVVSNFSAVPLPGAFWLFGSALVGVGATVRRNKFQLTSC
ncbi:hypothetical protein [Methylomonas sp. AM2-LC]|uniref:hypothetical protein n=1 Tax=Methylomonas sp. AM2-LC TaxID=3153301 RepID=UPI003263BF71